MTHNNTLHKDIEIELLNEGYKKVGFRRSIIKQIILNQFGELTGEGEETEIDDDYGLPMTMTEHIHSAIGIPSCIPDVFKLIPTNNMLYKCGKGLLIEAVEVCIHNYPSYDKLGQYVDFWWACDSTGCLEFKLIIVDRFRNRHTLIYDIDSVDSCEEAIKKHSYGRATSC